MKLTEKDKLTLLGAGYLAEDLPTIEKRITGVKVYAVNNATGKEEKTTQRLFSNLFGRDMLILRASRAIFHGSSSTYNGLFTYIMEG